MQFVEKSSAEGVGPLIEADVILVEFGIIIKNSHEGHWFSPRDRRDSCEYLHGLLRDTLDRSGRIDLRVTASSLEVNGHDHALDSAHSRYFQETLRRLDVTNLTFEKEMDDREFIVLLDALCLPSERIKELGGLSAMLEVEMVQNIRLKRLKYREVSEDAIVLERRELKAEGIDAANLTVESVKGFLRGDAQVTQAEADALKSLAEEDIDGLAGEIKKAAKEDDSASVEDSLVDSLRRVYKGLRDGGVGSTQKEKQELRRLLGQLEASLQTVLEGEGEDGKHLHQAVDDIASSLEAESLAVAYARQRKLLERDEQRILRFVAQRGEGDVGTRSLKHELEEAGFDPVQYESLLLRCGLGELPRVAEMPDAVRRLQNLAHRVEESTSREGLEPGQINAVLEQLDNEMRGLTDMTERRINRFLAALREDERRASKKSPEPPAMSRKKLMTMLAEIIQELCQPLSVVSCTLGMLASRNLGELSSTQTEMVLLAQENSQRLEGLVEHLRNLSGNPDTLSPDAAIIGQLYA